MYLSFPFLLKFFLLCHMQLPNPACLSAANSSLRSSFCARVCGFGLLPHSGIFRLVEVSILCNRMNPLKVD